MLTAGEPRHVADPNRLVADPNHGSVARLRQPTLDGSGATADAGGMLGLLIVDHGSRRAEANAQLDDMAERVAALSPGHPIATAHLDVCAPTIADGVDSLLSRGADEIAVLMYFLSDGRHVREDVPALVRAALSGRPDVRVRLGGALGPDDALARLMLARAGVGGG